MNYLLYSDWCQPTEVGIYPKFCHHFEGVAPCFQQLQVLYKVLQMDTKTPSKRSISINYSNPATNCTMLSAFMPFLWFMGKLKASFSLPSLSIFMLILVMSHYHVALSIRFPTKMSIPGIQWFLLTSAVVVLGKL